MKNTANAGASEVTHNTIRMVKRMMAAAKGDLISGSALIAKLQERAERAQAKAGGLGRKKAVKK